jgi:hypothetical protein
LVGNHHGLSLLSPVSPDLRRRDEQDGGKERQQDEARSYPEQSWPPIKSLRAGGALQRLVRLRFS